MNRNATIKEYHKNYKYKCNNYYKTCKKQSNKQINYFFLHIYLSRNYMYILNMYSF